MIFRYQAMLLLPNFNNIKDTHNPKYSICEHILYVYNVHLRYPLNYDFLYKENTVRLTTDFSLTTHQKLVDYRPFGL